MFVNNQAFKLFQIILNHIKFRNADGRTIINAVDRSGLTPLHLAAQKGDIDIVKVIASFLAKVIVEVVAVVVVGKKVLVEVVVFVVVVGVVFIVAGILDTI